jgi:hypothetical protein
MSFYVTLTEMNFLWNGMEVNPACERNGRILAMATSVTRRKNWLPTMGQLFA